MSNLTDPHTFEISSNGRRGHGDHEKRLKALERGGSSGGAGGSGVSTLAGDATGPAAGNVVQRATGNFPVYGPRPYVDVTHPTWGADPTGTTGDLGLIINAIVATFDEKGGCILMPDGMYLCGTRIDLIDKPVSLIGAGFGGDIFHNGVWHAATEIVWNGAAGESVLRVTSGVKNDGTGQLSGGFELDGFAIDGGGAAVANSTGASIGVDLRSARFGKIGTIGVRKLQALGACYDYNCASADPVFNPADVNTTTGVITIPNHGFVQHRFVSITSAGRLPAGFTPGAAYYVRNPTANTFQLSTTTSDAGIIVPTDQGTVTHSIVVANNTMMIQADHLIGIGPYIIRFRGREDVGPINSCLNRIEHVSGTYGTAANNEVGIWYHGSGCDNNTIAHCYLPRGAGTGVAVEYGCRSRANNILHLEGQGGVVTRSFASSGAGVSNNNNRVFHYDRSNSESAPAFYPSTFGSISSVTNTAPILVSTGGTPHGLGTGDGVYISGVTGTTTANGVWEVNRVSDTTFELIGSTASSAYISGGTYTRHASRMTWSEDGSVGGGTGPTGWYINALTKDSISGQTSVRLLSLQDTAPELNVRASGASSVARVRTLAFQSDAATTILGIFDARGDTSTGGPHVLIGSQSNHPVAFRQNSTEVFRLDLSNVARFILTTGAVQGTGVGFNSAGGVGSTAGLTALGGFLSLNTSGPVLDFSKTAVSNSLIRGYISSDHTQPAVSFMGDQIRYGPGTTGAQDVRIRRPTGTPQMFSIEGDTGGASTWTTASYLTFPTAGSRIGVGVAVPGAALQFASDTTSPGGIYFGADAAPIALYRCAANAARFTTAAPDTNNTRGLGFNADVGGTSLTALGGFLSTTSTGVVLDMSRSASTGAILRGWLSSSAANPAIVVRNDGIRLGPGGATGAVDFAMSRSGTRTVTFDDAAAGGMTLTFSDGSRSAEFLLGTTNGLKIGTNANQLIALYGGTPRAQSAAMTARNATAPGVVYTAAEQGIIANLQTRVNELADALNASATGKSLIAGTA